MCLCKPFCATRLTLSLAIDYRHRTICMRILRETDYIFSQYIGLQDSLCLCIA